MPTAPPSCPRCQEPFSRKWFGLGAVDGDTCQVCDRFVCSRCIGRPMLKTGYLAKKYQRRGPRREVSVPVCGACFKAVTEDRVGPLD